MSTKIATISWKASNGLQLHKTVCLESTAAMIAAERMLEQFHEEGISYRIEGDLLKCLDAVALTSTSLVQPDDLKPYYRKD